MLSITYTIPDMMKELETYEVYGYAATAITGITGTVVASTKTVTRAAGSWVDDGVAVGHVLTFAGFANAGNNAAYTVMTVCALSLTGTTSTTMVNETAKTGVSATPSTGDTTFRAALAYAVDQAKYNRMYPVMGDDDYDEIEDLNRDGCTTEQMYIYKAELFYALAEFIALHARKEKYNRRAKTEGRSQGDQSSSMSGSTGKDWVISEYVAKGDKYLAEAGYNVQVRLVRREGIYTYAG